MAWQNTIGRAGIGLRHAVVAALALTVAACGLAPGADDAAQAPRVETSTVRDTERDVVLIVVDTWRADRLEGSRAGKPIMPNMARYAADHAYYTGAVSACSWTRPSMVSLLTSLHPDAHRVLYGVSDKDLAGVDTGTAQVVPESLETMAEYLKEAGYTTVGIQSNVNLKPDFGLAHGFDTYETWIYPEHRGTTVTDKALEKLREVSSPYFLYVHYMDTHWTYDPPEPHRSAFGSFPELSETDRELLAHYPDYYFDKVFGDLNVKERRMAELSEAGREYVRQLYDGAARYVDAELQRLLTEIERRSPNAIILITGDHGEELWDHNSLGHSKTLYQELIHVPLIVRVPGAPPKRSDAPVHLTDLLPATAGLLGLPARPWWQGSDFLREGGLPGDRLLFSSTYTSLPTNNVHLESVIRGKDKLILDRKKDAARLFDLAGDPAERHDLAEARPEQVAALRQALVEQQEANAKNPAAPKDVEAVELSDELVEQLKAGGYFR